MTSVQTLLWSSALAVIPLAIAVGLACRWLPLRSATRHALWLMILVMPVLLPLLAELPRPVAVLGADRQAIRTGGQEQDLASSDRVASVPPVPRSTLVPAASSRVDGSVGAGEFWPDIAGPARAASDTRRERRPESVAAVSASTPSTVAPRPAALIESPPPAPPPRGTEPSSPTSALTLWADRLEALWVALMAIPPLPASLWLGGLALLATLLGLRVARSARLLRYAHPAPDAVTALVAEEAAALGIRRTPATSFVDRQITPLIWCGRRPRLVLPTALWAQLDDAGRRAVILHELAHLKRRDHVVCWVRLVIGCVYWWHPVIWIAERRLREEADLSCDAWVTATHPNARRAYAQALLETRRFLSGLHPDWLAGPAIGLGVHSTRARLFSRRLTMVMTEHRAPKFSLRGAMVIATLALTAYLVAPALACPPDKKKQVKVPPRAQQPTHPLAPLPPPPPGPRGIAPNVEESTFEQFIRDRDRQRERSRQGDGSLEERMLQLEQQLERLHQMLERVDFATPMPPGPPAVAPFGVRWREDVAAPQGELVTRVYTLPQGKLDALTQLMARSDVPLLINRMDEGIEVQATPWEHHIIAAFCQMIDGEERIEAYELSEEKLEALTELMVRRDVPVLVEPGANQIKLHGNELEQMVFRAFVDLIEPPGPAEAPSVAASAFERAQEYERALEA